MHQGIFHILPNLCCKMHTIKNKCSNKSFDRYPLFSNRLPKNLLWKLSYYNGLWSLIFPFISIKSKITWVRYNEILLNLLKIRVCLLFIFLIISYLRIESTLPFIHLIHFSYDKLTLSAYRCSSQFSMDLIQGGVAYVMRNQ